MSLLIGAALIAFAAYIAVHYRRASHRVDHVIELSAALPTRGPGESFADWADNALATFDDEDTAREYAADRCEDIALTASWIESMACDQFNAAVVLHLDAFPR
jgi:hypothetical protein